MAGDGQVTYGYTVLKGKARKVRTLYNGKVLAGFAGATADAFTLFERFEEKLTNTNGNISRAAVEMAKDWRMDRYLRHLEAVLIVMDEKHIFLISGDGDVIEPDDNVMAIGSGGDFALVAARALMKHSSLDAHKIVKEAMRLASELCIYTNDKIIVEELKL
jgi:ATP-dependent HslUV protease subunit HslV